MRLKHKIYYEITPDGPNIHNSEYWYGGGRWFVPQYDENGRGLNNPTYSNTQRCYTKKSAIKAARKLFSLVKKPVRISVSYRKNGEWWQIFYFLNK
jgi:hypothetical protein